MPGKRKSGQSQSFAMRPLNKEFQEDEYGYVNPAEDEQSQTFSTKRGTREISKNIMMQLPSRNIDDLLGPSTSTDTATDSGTLDLGTCRRRSTYRTMRLKSAFANVEQLNADQVYEILTKDAEMSPEEMKNALREMHHTLTTKRILKRRLNRDEEIRRQSRRVSWATLTKYKLEMFCQHLKYDLRDISYSLELWHRHVKVIQGKFGTGVTSYFIFLRWLLYLNIFTFIIMVVFVVIPQWIYETGTSSYHGNSSASFTFSDFLTGSGWLANSVLFYGHYTNNTIHLMGELEYDMPLAYLFTSGVFAIANLVIVALSLAKSYQKNYISSVGEMKNVFCNKVFCAWDYGIETKNAADLRMHSIYNDLKETLSAEMEVKVEETIATRLLNGCVCFFSNILVLSIISGAGVLVHVILHHNALQVDIPVVRQMTLPIAVTVIGFVSYQVFHLIGRLEWFFGKETQLYLTMCRTVLLKIVILGVILRFWMLTQMPESASVHCYETDLGEEIYRLVLVNFIFSLIFCTIIGEMLRKLFYSYVKTWFGHPQFDIAYNTLDVIYYQTLLWLGLFFSPLLPLVVIVVYVLQFYIKYCSVCMNCIPSAKPWCASHARTVFLCLTFLNFLLCILAIGYNILGISPSTTCGPFRLLEKRYDVVVALFPPAGKENVVLSKILQYATSSGVVAAVITALCVVVYCVRAQALGYEKMVKLILNQLIMEGKDKVFLLKLFDQALAQKNASHWTDRDTPGTSGMTERRGSSPAPRRESDNSRCEVVNQVYKDYYHGISPASSPTSRSAFAGKYNPGYLPAAVPTNDIAPDYSDSDSVCSQENVQGNHRNRASSDTVSRGSDSDKKIRRVPRALSPRNANSASSSSSNALSSSQGDLRSPTRKGARRSGDLFPRPLHQQGFQYLARGETPPRFNQTSDNITSPGKTDKTTAE